MFIYVCSYFLLPLNVHAIACSYESIPDYWKWMNRISPTTWIIYGLVSDQVRGIRCMQQCWLLLSDSPGCCSATSSHYLPGPKAVGTQM